MARRRTVCKPGKLQRIERAGNRYLDQALLWTDPLVQAFAPWLLIVAVALGLAYALYQTGALIIGY